MKSLVVTLGGTIPINTTVAVLAESEAEAVQKALDGVVCNTEDWLHVEELHEAPRVLSVDEETCDELQYADQRHLVGA